MSGIDFHSLGMGPVEPEKSQKKEQKGSSGVVHVKTARAGQAKIQGKVATKASGVTYKIQKKALEQGALQGSSSKSISSSLMAQKASLHVLEGLANPNEKVIASQAKLSKRVYAEQITVEQIVSLFAGGTSQDVQRRAYEYLYNPECRDLAGALFNKIEFEIEQFKGAATDLSDKTSEAVRQLNELGDIRTGFQRAMVAHLFDEMRQSAAGLDKLAIGIQAIMKPEVFFQQLLEHTKALTLRADPEAKDMLRDIYNLSKTWIGEHTSSAVLKETIARIGTQLSQAGFKDGLSLIESVYNAARSLKLDLPVGREKSLDVFESVRFEMKQNSDSYKQAVADMAADMGALQVHALSQISAGDVVDSVAGNGAQIRKVTSVTEGIVNLLVSQLLLTSGDKTMGNLLSFYLDVALAAAERGDTSSVMAVNAALNNSAIVRLSGYKKFEASCKDRLNELRQLVNTNGNYKALRQHIEEKGERLQETPTFLPFLGMTLTDLTFMRDGNPDVVKSGLNGSKMKLFSDKGLRYFRTMQPLLPMMNKIPRSDLGRHVMKMSQLDKEDFDAKADLTSRLIQPRGENAVTLKEFKSDLKGLRDIEEKMLYKMASLNFKKTHKFLRANPSLEGQVKQQIDMILRGYESGSAPSARKVGWSSVSEEADTQSLDPSTIAALRDHAKLRAYEELERIIESGQVPTIDESFVKCIKTHVQIAAQSGDPTMDKKRILRNFVMKFLPIPYGMISRSFAKARSRFKEEEGVALKAKIKNFASDEVQKLLGRQSKELEQLIRLHNYGRVEDALVPGQRVAADNFTPELPPDFQLRLKKLQAKKGASTGKDEQQLGNKAFKDEVYRMKYKYGDKLERLDPKGHHVLTDSLTRLSKIKKALDDSDVTAAQRDEYVSLKRGVWHQIQSSENWQESGAVWVTSRVANDQLAKFFEEEFCDH